MNVSSTLVVIEEATGPVTFTRDAGKPECVSVTGDRLVIAAGGKLLGTNMQMLQAVVQARAVASDDGRVLASRSAQGSLAQGTAELAVEHVGLASTAATGVASVTPNRIDIQAVVEKVTGAARVTLAAAVLLMLLRAVAVEAGPEEDLARWTCNNLDAIPSKSALDAILGQAHGVVGSKQAKVSEAKAAVLAARRAEQNDLNEIGRVERRWDEAKSRYRTEITAIETKLAAVSGETTRISTELTSKRAQLAAENAKSRWQRDDTVVAQLEADVARLQAQLTTVEGAQGGGERLSDLKVWLASADQLRDAELAPMRQKLDASRAALKAAQEAERQAADNATWWAERAAALEQCVKAAKTSLDKNPGVVKQGLDAIEKLSQEFQGGSGGKPTGPQAGAAAPAGKQAESYTGGGPAAVPAAKAPPPTLGGMPPPPPAKPIDSKSLIPPPGVSAGTSPNFTPPSPPPPAPKPPAAAPQPAQQQAQSGVHCYDWCVKGCLANKGTGYWPGMCAPYQCHESRITPEACSKSCEGYRGKYDAKCAREPGS